MPRKKITDSCIRPLNTLTVAGMYISRCVNRSKPTNRERNTLNRSLDLSLTANKVRIFRNYQLCLFQLKMGQVMWRMLTFM